MFCENCGKENIEGTKLCSERGKTLEYPESQESELSNMQNNITAENSGKELNEEHMNLKLVKQPLFFIGVGSFICAIAIAITSTMIKPHYSVVNKFEKAVNEKNTELLAECISPSTVETLDVSNFTSEIETMLLFMGIEGEVEIEILVSKGDAGEEENEEIVPAVMAIKADGKIVDYQAIDGVIVEIDGKQYLE